MLLSIAHKFYMIKRHWKLKNRLPLDLIEQNMQNQYTLLASASRSANMDRIIRLFWNADRTV